MSEIVETGTNSNVVMVEIRLKDRWLISYARDEESGMLLWHEIRPMDEADLEALRQKFIAAKVEWEMLNLTSAERGEPFTIEEYLRQRDH